MSVSLEQVIAAAARRLAPLTAECAGHAVLAVADQVVHAPALVEAATLSLEESGTMRMLKGTPSDALASEQRLRSLLDELMRVARGGGGALFRAAMREAEGDLPRFVRELEAALIPANRAAAKRSLARLHRETLRAVEAGSLDIPMPEPAPRRATVEANTPSDAPGGSSATAAPQSSPARKSPTPPPLPVAKSPTPPPPPLPVAKSPTPPPLPVAEARDQAAVTASGESESEALLEIDVHVSPVPPAETRVAPESLPAHGESAPPAPEPVEDETPLEPVLQRMKQRESLLPTVDDGRTPYLGTLVTEMVPPPLPAPLPLPEGSLADDGATDRMPPVASIDDEIDCDDEALTPYLDRSSTVASVETGAPAPAAGEPAEPAGLEQEHSELPPGVASLGLKQPLPESVDPAPARYTRKSDVSELVQNFSVADPEPSRSLLRDLKNLAGLESSATPPPVAVGLEQSKPESDEAKPAGASIRPVVTVSVLGAVLSAVALAGPGIVNAEPSAAARQPSAAATPAVAVTNPESTPEVPCRAAVDVVGAPSNARIEVRAPGRDGKVAPQWATGPEAKFSELPCSTPLEVLVRSGSDEERHWTRVPISAAELSPTGPKSGGVQFEVDVTRRELY